MISHFKAVTSYKIKIWRNQLRKNFEDQKSLAIFASIKLSPITRRLRFWVNTYLLREGWFRG